jgi:hypothetical protein
LDYDQGTSYICGEAKSDTEEPDLKEEAKLHCLTMSVLSYENHKTLPVEGLLLLPEDHETFRRVGFFKIYSTTMFDGVSEWSIRIT